MNFRPLHDRVLVRRVEAEEKTAGGIIIPDTAKEKPQEGEVIAVGGGAKSEEGKVTPLDVKAGDRILFGNIYTHKTLSGSFSIRNPHLEKLLIAKAKNSEQVWNSILEQGGSVQHLDFLSQEEKDTFKTSFEIDQRWLIELAADRTPYIDQATSLNLFIPADVDKWDLMMLHFRAWELGIKSLYYLRSKSVQRAGFAGGVEADNTAEAPKYELAATTDYDECLACQ